MGDAKRYIVLTGMLCLSGVITLKAQQERNQGVIWSSLKGLECTVEAGINIDGTASVPLPRKIRAIGSYRLALCVSIEGDIKKWFGEGREWGMMIGLRLENKGTGTKTTVKSYSMETIDSGGEKLKRNRTGGVQTKAKNTYFSIPAVALHQSNNRVSFSMGLLVPFATNRNFPGYVYDGYLRGINPTGTKVEFSGDNRASYDFSDNLREFQWEAQIGTEWKAFKHLIAYANLMWGLNDIFQEDFGAVTFGAYPIYLNVGFGYVF